MIDTETRESSCEDEQPTVRKLTPNNNNTVLLRTTAVRVINSSTRRSTLVYAQHDTASQDTSISERLKNELDLAVDKKRNITIRNLAQKTTSSGGLTEIALWSLSTDETFQIKNALVVPEFADNEATLPHAVNVEKLEHFLVVTIPVIGQRKSIDILIGQTDKSLLTVLEERESKHPDHPNYVLTRLGPIASGGRLGVGRSVCKNFEIQGGRDCDGCECEQLQQEIDELKESLRNYEIEDEVKEPSINDEIIRQLVESNVKTINGRYEIPVPLKMDVVANLPDNYVCALNRTTNLGRNAIKNVKLKDILEETFQEMISEGWIVSVDDAILSDIKYWYLPFFVTKQDKARVVFDETATFKGAALNDAVHSGINLLNGLVKVLTRFSMGRYACTTDLSKCFFQVAVPESQRDLFRLIWYRNNDLDEVKFNYIDLGDMFGELILAFLLHFLQMKN